MNVFRASLVSLLTVVAAISAYGCSSSSNNNPGGGGGGGGDGGGGGGGGCTGGDGCFAVSLSVTEDHSCAIMKDGTARCWGSGFHGGRGRGPNDTSTYEPQPVVQLANAASIFVNDDNSCAFLKNGSVSCWGTGDTEGNGTGGAIGGAGETEVPKAIDIGQVPAISLVGNGLTTCTLLQTGKVSCWQSTLQLRPVDTTVPEPTLSPAVIEGSSDGREIAVGGSPHLCILTGAGAVNCIGANSAGQLGYDSSTIPPGNPNESSVFTPVNGLPNNVAHIRAGGEGTCAILTDGSLQCWGANSTNPADVNDPSRHTPYPVAGLTNVADVAVGGHSCAVRQDGTVWCWGSNSHGELGDGTTTDSTTPVQVQGVNNATSIAVGSETSCIIQNDGRVACWGSNGTHEFGTSSSDSIVAHPVVVPF